MAVNCGKACIVGVKLGKISLVPSLKDFPSGTPSRHRNNSRRGDLLGVFMRNFSRADFLWVAEAKLARMLSTSVNTTGAVGSCWCCGWACSRHLAEEATL